MLTALLLSLTVNGNDGAPSIHCTFPPTHSDQKPIHIVLEPRPSLKDQPGLYRVMMDFDGHLTVKASARPILATTAPDILIRGTTQKRNMYSLGLRADGTAAFNIQQPSEEKVVDKRTRIGECRGHEAHIHRWLSS